MTPYRFGWIHHFDAVHQTQRVSHIHPADPFNLVEPLKGGIGAEQVVNDLAAVHARI
jgi:hypothetical protein